ncbi:phosphatidylinositol N-acetylglucosaminyltransferase subunit Q [Diachasma alloeum]|uniref:phosphatidylinositol N-acetylglucosaminyltransferase subunit Q n=1 Tax=Diachasma alloeum TaxID=454923 RepID=UPI0007383660|nr:phosphatidylinositol N-acetylglucosaminyltransferase subunit Q [Diachasma alloeum]XP_015111253.1 phosphatidylinositol N-acetylglucosaminyltransferase subunit Q [Diachasma alloeum]XP_015111254.1 phosphatidylinositol N-acetylglucosaminyltransferase subunit Q [Diachasma alloeum]XP_028981888.1 phosphatidylinositol N-acetylglucosaminyltransferase subunit Q [Diachasma alloeum]
MKSLLVFIPRNFCNEAPGYINGKVVYDQESESKKFYIIGTQSAPRGTPKIHSDLIGYYSGSTGASKVDKRVWDWIEISSKPSATQKSHDYYLKSVTVDNQRIEMTLKSQHTVKIIYDQVGLLEAELFRSDDQPGNHFLELKEILERRKIEVKEKGVLVGMVETLLMYTVLCFMYPVMSLGEVTNMLMPVLKYSTLGLHVNGWLENTKWTLATIVQERRVSLKTRNHILATMFDVSLGVMALRLLLHYIGGIPPSQMLLDNAEKVVESLKSLIHWLMGSPAGLKLNHSFNKMLGNFFLYHIHLWWTFLVSIKPVMDFFFEVLLLFGRLGITFQISIAADLLALVSFHTYCIYIYAARLFNIQIRGLTALFRLFLGKKRNPLRERVDSCQYQADQLFVGTLLFTIILFLMPTTWVYYSVFTTLRLILIGFGGFLTRLRFYLQVIPAYTFFCWVFRSRSANSSVKLLMKSRDNTGAITLLMTTVAAPWRDTWKRCIPDTLTYHPSIEWGVIVSNIFWGQLLYPL